MYLCIHICYTCIHMHIYTTIYNISYIHHTRGRREWPSVGVPGAIKGCPPVTTLLYIYIYIYIYIMLYVLNYRELRACSGNNKNVVCLTWLQHMSAYSAGHIKVRGSKETNHSFTQTTEVFLASAMHSPCTTISRSGLDQSRPSSRGPRSGERNV